MNLHHKLGFALAFMAMAAVAEQPPQVSVENPFNADNVFDATSALSASSGRKGKTNGAQIAAMIGAGVASGMCLYLMKKARELPPGSEKTLMQMQAMQQCQQAAQNMANAGQNGDNADNLTTPQVAQNGLPQNLQGATEAPQQSGQQQFLPGGRASTPSNNFQAPAAAQADDQEATVATNTDPGRRGVGTVNSLARAPSLSQTVLNPIPEQSLTFDDQAGLGSDSGFNGGSGGAYLANSGDIDFDKLEEKLSAQDALEKLEESARRIRERGDTAGGANGDAGGGDSTDSGDEDSGFNNVLSSFFGGGGGQVITPGGTGSGALSLKGKDGAKKPGINIFEYASYRYKRLQRKEGRIVSKLALAKPKKPGQK